MEKDLNYKITHLNVDGGASLNSILLQFQANILDTLILRPRFIETTALGSGFLAGLNSGFWHSKSDLKELRSDQSEYSPQKDFPVDIHMGQWRNALAHCLAKR